MKPLTVMQSLAQGSSGLLSASLGLFSLQHGGTRMNQQTSDSQKESLADSEKALKQQPAYFAHPSADGRRHYWGQGEIKHHIFLKQK